MTPDRDVEALLDAWFADGPTQVSGRVFDDAVERLHREPQRPAWRLDWRTRYVSWTIRAIAAAAAIVVVGLVGFRILGGGAGPSVGGPRPSPTATAAAAPSSSTAATPRACDLITADEVAAALNLSSTVRPDSNINGANAVVNYCVYSAAGVEVLGISYQRTGGEPVFETWKSQSGTQAVPGLGDQAVWDPVQKTLFLLKGASLVDVSGGSMTLETAKALAAIIVARM